MLVEEINRVGVETLQRLMGHLADARRLTIYPTDSALLIEVELEFCGDNNLVVETDNCLAKQLFVSREQIDIDVNIVIAGDAIQDEIKAPRVLLHPVSVLRDDNFVGVPDASHLLRCSEKL